MNDRKFMIFCISTCFCGLAFIGIVSTVQEIRQLTIRNIVTIVTNDTGPSPTTTPPIDWISIFLMLSPILAKLVPIIKESAEGRKWKKKYKKIETPSTILRP